MTDSWKEAILEHIPHGEDGHLGNLKWEDAITLQKLLLKNGFAVCITGGDFEDEYVVAWVYAGDAQNLDYANYENVAFFHIDYLEEYPEAYYKEYGIEESGFSKIFDDSDEVEVLPTKPEVSE